MTPSLRNPWPDIDPGEFRHQYTALISVPVSDASGSTVTYKSCVPAVQFWAKETAIRGTDVIKAGQDVSQVYLVLVTRYRAQLANLAQQRIQGPSGGQYIVQAVENIGRMNMYLELTCIALGANE
jgi:SPP1 family predicted phage head-tail adaptor